MERPRSLAASTSPTSIAARYSGIVVVRRRCRCSARATPRSRASCSTRARSGRRRRAAASCRRARRPRRPPARARGTAEAPDPADDEPAVEPEPAAHGVAIGRRARNSSGSAPVGVITMRRVVDADAPHLFGDRLRSARDDVGRAQRRPLARRARSTGPNPAGARPTAAPATRAARARTPPTARRAPRARRGPAVWNSSWRCHTHATSCPRHGPVRIDAERARPPPLARVLHRGLRDHRARAAASRRRTRPRASPPTPAGAARRAPSRRRASRSTRAPSSRRSPLAHPAALTHAATGPCWPAATVGSTTIAPRARSGVAASLGSRPVSIVGSRYRRRRA